ncbi:uncharacterized protein LOC129716858 [Wyeomyia smithii]|uniref:uncharacterized protein LOC129716858 n=1 Tax=Wyeomyia smithii TaxID=174621 RepID=UPI0024681A01|nr:uncharacterized protein LOC129716858 [Wyeomyia smithii]
MAVGGLSIPPDLSSCSEGEESVMDFSDTPNNSVDGFSEVKKKRKRPRHTASPIPSTNDAPIRVKKYQKNQPGLRWVVYIRPKNKPLKVVQICKTLRLRYTSLIEVYKVKADKLKVTFSDLEHANAVVEDQNFTIEYRVYIPARAIEIEGVITEPDLTEKEILEGTGRFKNPNLPEIKILECRRMYSKDNMGKYSPNDSFRVTFEGKVLPDYLELFKLRLPVRLFIPKVMTCTNCLQLGHTKAYCSNKTKCCKCGAIMENNHTCSEQEAKCSLCGGNPHRIEECAKYKLRSDALKKSTRQRSKQSFAQMLKTALQQEENRYSSLENDDSNDDEEDYQPLLSTGAVRKRPSASSPKLPRKEQKKALNDTPRGSTSKQNAKASPPGFKVVCDKEFPKLPGKRAVPTAKLSSESEKPSFDGFGPRNESWTRTGCIKWIPVVVS